MVDYLWRWLAFITTPHMCDIHTHTHTHTQAPEVVKAETIEGECWLVFCTYSVQCTCPHYLVHCL